MRHIATATAILTLAFSNIACDNGEGSGGARPPAKPAAAAPAAAPAAPAAAAAPASAPAAAKPAGDEQSRYTAAKIEGGCAVPGAENIKAAADAVRGAYEKQGFNQLSFSKAEETYKDNAEVKAAVDAGLAKCPAKAEGKAEAKAKGGGKAIPKWAVPAAGTKGSAGATAKPAKPAAKPKLGAHAGNWAGNFTSSNVRGTLKLAAGPSGKVVGEVTPAGGQAFGVGGMVKAGKVALEATKPGGDTINLLGNLDAKKNVIEGSWRGKIAGQSAHGSWRATKK